MDEEVCFVGWTTADDRERISVYGRNGFRHLAPARGENGPAAYEGWRVDHNTRARLAYRMLTQSGVSTDVASKKSNHLACNLRRYPHNWVVSSIRLREWIDSAEEPRSTIDFPSELPLLGGP